MVTAAIGEGASKTNALALTFVGGYREWRHAGGNDQADKNWSPKGAYLYSIRKTDSLRDRLSGITGLTETEFRKFIGKCLMHSTGFPEMDSVVNMSSRRELRWQWRWYDHQSNASALALTVVVCCWEWFNTVDGWKAGENTVAAAAVKASIQPVGKWSFVICVKSRWLVVGAVMVM